MLLTTVTVEDFSDVNCKGKNVLCASADALNATDGLTDDLEQINQIT